MKKKVLNHRKQRVIRREISLAFKMHEQQQEQEKQTAWDNYYAQEETNRAFKNGFHGDYEWMIGE